MKCICGFDDAEIINPDDKFIRLYERLSEAKRSIMYERGVEVALYMCPECGTIKGERVW